MNTEIIKGNKLIAEFMGATIDELDNVKFILPADGVGLAGCGLRACRYHSSWDWLMPVVEKIEGLFNGNSFTITNRNLWCIIEMNTQFSLAYDIEYSEISIKASTKLESTWQAVVQFIQWYNTQTKQPR
jgi:hypothetical protein